MVQFSSKPPLRKKFWESDRVYTFVDLPQHNPTNPLLLAYRDGDVNADQIIHMSGVLVGAWVGPTVITETHTEHARKVLERIKAVFG